jgi:hypothetical protein
MVRLIRSPCRLKSLAVHPNKLAREAYLQNRLFAPGLVASFFA